MVHVRKAWLLTKAGISLTRKITGLTCVGLFCYQVAPHTLLIPLKREEQERVMIKTMGTKDLPKDVLLPVRRFLDDANFTEKQRKALTVHLAHAEQTYTYGNVNLPFGAYVKIPWNMTGLFPLPTELKGIENADPDAAERFLKSREWSEKAKLFLIAYQVAWARQYSFFWHGIVTGVMPAAAYTACYIFSTRQPAMKASSPRAFIVMNGVIIAMFLTVWAFMTDYLSCLYEEEVVSGVCRLNEDYAEGAVELFQKMQQHNIALRDLLGFVGQLRHLKNGNVRTLRRTTLPLDERVALAQSYLDAHRNKKSAETPTV